MQGEAMSSRRHPPPERKPPEYEIDIKYKIFTRSQDGLLKTPGQTVDRRSYSDLDDYYDSIEAAAAAILIDDDQNHETFLVLPVVRKRIKI